MLMCETAKFLLVGNHWSKVKVIAWGIDGKKQLQKKKINCCGHVPASVTVTCILGHSPLCQTKPFLRCPNPGAGFYLLWRIKMEYQFKIASRTFSTPSWNCFVTSLGHGLSSVMAQFLKSLWRFLPERILFQVPGTEMSFWFRYSLIQALHQPWRDCHRIQLTALVLLLSLCSLLQPLPSNPTQPNMWILGAEAHLPFPG